MQQGFVVGNNHFLHRMIYQSENDILVEFYFVFILLLTIIWKVSKIQKELIHSHRRQAVTEP